MSSAQKLAIGSVAVGILVLALKMLAWWITGSIALLSDALESTVNVVTAFVALAAIRLAQRPPDQTHPYGHHKAEFFSAVLEGVMIVVAALLILREAWLAFLTPEPVTAPLQGILINGAATAINALWCWMLITRGRRLGSPALVADGRHLLADVVTSAGVALGVLLAMATGWGTLDPVMAALVALNILWSGWTVIRGSLSGLLDEAVAPDTLSEVKEIIAEEASGAFEAHDLRTRQAGSRVFIDFHLVVPGDMTVSEAHDVCDRVEAALRRALADVSITIHVEPEHKAKQSGIVVLD